MTKPSGRIWKCTVCGKRSVWKPKDGWHWLWGCTEPDGNVAVFCSDKCCNTWLEFQVRDDRGPLG